MKNGFDAREAGGFGAEGVARGAQLFKPHGVVFAIDFFQLFADTLG